MHDLRTGCSTNSVAFSPVRIERGHRASLPLQASPSGLPTRRHHPSPDRALRRRRRPARRDSLP
eukprot:6226649-Prorocentrum_lima.AAC.1